MVTGHSMFQFQQINCSIMTEIDEQKGGEG